MRASVCAHMDQTESTPVRRRSGRAPSWLPALTVGLVSFAATFVALVYLAGRAVARLAPAASERVRRGFRGASAVGVCLGARGRWCGRLTGRRQRIDAQMRTAFDC